MRAMLGTNGAPSLLVDIEQEHSLKDFDFWVVNGAWSGSFTNGHVTVWGAPSGDFSSLDKVEVLCCSSDRLRGKYQEVFNNFSNPNYRAPKHKEVEMPTDWDDDIPF